MTAQSALDADGGTEISIRSEDGSLGTKNSVKRRLAPDIAVSPLDVYLKT